MSDERDVLEALNKALLEQERLYMERLTKRLAEPTEYHYTCGQLHSVRWAQQTIRDIIQKQRNQDALIEGD